MGPLVILGPGNLGLSLARHAAERGLEVRLVGRTCAQAEHGIHKITAAWHQAQEKDNLDPETFRARVCRLHSVENLEQALEAASCLVEALPESLALKATCWRAIWAAMPENTLPLTASSSLPAGLIRKNAGLGPGLQNFHVFVPVHRHPLVELASPKDTPPAYLAGARELAVSLGLHIVDVNESQGLAASRMGLAQGLEAMRLLQNGHGSIQGLDALMTLGYGHPCGPLELSDRIGLDLRLTIADFYHETTGNPAFAPPAILKEKVAKGELGRKSGKGFYVWTPGGTKA